MTNRVLAFIVCLPIAAAIGFAAGRATAPLGTIMRADSPDGAAHVRVDRRFSLRAPDHRLVIAGGGDEVELKRLDESTGMADQLLWSSDGLLAAALINGSKLTVIDAPGKRILYELPLFERLDGSREARGAGFSSNAQALVFDDCPRYGAGCRPRIIALPRNSTR